MASYQELKSISSDPNILERLMIAIAITAYNVAQEPPETPNYDNRRRWAREALFSPDLQAQRIIWLLLAQYNALSIVQIQAVTDVNLQAAVDDAIELFL